ncbi:acyl-CoA synthetase [Microbacterium sp.]|uniref:acyl-CoA synthetase n=1 Tax=Microbacterium sp. TaxID=51671 RepID=UPI003C795740
MSDDASAAPAMPSAGDRATAPAAARTFDVRHVQVGRALLAAVAAIMVTFSSDHSAPVGLAIFSGWVVATALVLLVAAWLVYPKGRRATPILLGVLALVAGMVTGIPGIRSTTLFFVVVIAWALASGIAELVAGIRGIRSRRTDGVAAGEDRDRVLIGALTVALGLGLLLVNPAYSLEYVLPDVDVASTLTGITIAVGLFGGYAAIIAVFLGIAGFSPRRPAVVATVAPGERSGSQ